MHTDRAPYPRRILLGLLALALAVTGLLAPTDPASAEGATLASDSMSREVTRGWGSADVGGAYAASPAHTGTVTAGVGTLVSDGPGLTSSMTLSAVSASDVLSRIDVTFPQLPTGAGKAYVGFFARGEMASSYAVMVVVDARGESLVVLERKSDGQETKFSTVNGPRFRAGQAVTVEFAVVGSDAVTLGAKVWTAGEAEPDAWTSLAMDDTDGRITGPGPVGVDVYASTSGQATALQLDNLLVRQTSTVPTDPTPADPTPADPAPAASTPSSTATPEPTPDPTPTAPESLASDSMARTLTTGWGTADVGGSYVGDPTTAGEVASGRAGLVSTAAGMTSTMTLDEVRATDVTTSIDVSLPALPASGSKVYVTHFARGAWGGSYAAMLMVSSDGSSLLVLERRSGGREEKFASRPGPTVSAGRSVTVELSVVGSQPVSLGAKAWTTGTPAPEEWTVLAEDASSSQVSEPGPVGVSVYASSSGTVTPVRFDNLLTLASDTAPAATPTPAPTPDPASSTDPTPDPTDTDPDIRRTGAGAAPLGTLDYEVPSSALYVSTAGSDMNPGTKDRPFATISAATKAAGDHGTVVVRSGTYHEDVMVYPHEGLTLEAYPGEVVWVDGSETVTGWRKDGSTWVRDDWDTFFDASPTYTKGAPDGTAENWRWVNPDFPMASHPDQVWVDDAALTQVADRSEVVAGTFFVDEDAHQLVLGTDPAGRRVDVSTLSGGMSIRSTDGVVRGIGVRRFATSVPMMGTVSTYFTGVTLQDMVIADNATTGLFVGATGVSLDHVTVSGNGLMGMGATYADGLVVDSLLSEGNNAERFNCSPVSGAMKVGRSRDVSVRDSVFRDNLGQGPWFDESVHGITFAGNDVVSNSCNGVTVELSEQASLVDNLVVDNGAVGISVQDSGSVDIWNNTLVDNQGSIALTQDDRRAADLSVTGHDPRETLPDPTVSWITRDVTIANTVMSQDSGTFLLEVADWSHEFPSGDMLAGSDSNLFHSTSATTPQVFAVWYPDGTRWTTYPTLAAYRAVSGRDQASTWVVGDSPLDADHAVADSYAQLVDAAQPVPSSVAALSAGLKAGQRALGAIIP